MKKIVVIYMSNSGNTKAMAKAVAKGAQGVDSEVRMLEFRDAMPDDVVYADAVALGCPADSAETLDQRIVEPFVNSLQGKIDGKPLVLFGSYGWGDGSYMDDWFERMVGYGANLLADGLIFHEAPNSTEMGQCQVLGEKLQ